MSGSWRATARGSAGAARLGQVNAAAYQPERGRALRAVRHVIEAGLAVNGEVRLMSALIRPQVRLLVAERRDRDGPVVVISPAGPLTWNELELVQGLGDPLTLADLLPERPVAVGEHWRVRNSAAQALSEYDVVTSNTSGRLARIGRRRHGPNPAQGADSGLGAGRTGEDDLRRVLDLRSPGGPNRPP